MEAARGDRFRHHGVDRRSNSRTAVRQVLGNAASARPRDFHPGQRSLTTMRLLLIANPTSGRGAGARAVGPISEQLRSAGISFDVLRTERPWTAAASAAGADAQGGGA